jgi:lycopene beta-cyclase
MTRVLLLGGGPSAQILALACAERGLNTTVVSPSHAAAQHNLCAFEDELPPHFIAERFAKVTACVGGQDVELPAYARLNAEALALSCASHPRVRQVVATARDVRRLHAGGNVVTDDDILEAEVMVDCRGAAGGKWMQTAYGERLHAPAHHRPGAAVFMDWTASPLRDLYAPSFVYELHHSDGTTLFEETTLASVAPVPIDILRQRLHARLEARGIAGTLVGTEEVRIPMAVTKPARSDLAFGAAAGFVHPATGFSIARVIAVAPRLAEAITQTTDLVRLQQAVWPAHERDAFALLERATLAALRAKTNAELDAFFHAFFRVPEMRSFLHPTHVSSVAGVMLRMFVTAPMSLKRRLMLSAWPMGQTMQGVA